MILLRLLKVQKPILLIIFCCFFINFNGHSQTAKAISKIDSIRVVMKELAKNNEFSKISQFYSNDAVVNGFDGSFSGIEEVRKYWSNISGKGVDWEWKNLSYSGTNDFVTQTGISLLTLKYGEKIVTYKSQFSVIWEKHFNGNYKIVSDFYRRFIEPESYEISTDSVYINTGNDSIFGILFFPKHIQKSTVKVPAVVCLQGGGDVGLNNYFYEAKLFAQNGFVALVCDKAGAGRSKGKSSWVTQTFKEKTQEYIKLLQWLGKHPKVDAGKVGFHGLSEGGRLALDLAAKYPQEVAFVNAVSGPIESFKQNQLFAIQNLLEDRGYDVSTIARAITIWNAYFDNINEGKISNKTMSMANNLRNEEPEIYLPANSTELPNRPHKDDINYSSEHTVDQITCPVLFQYGILDKRVNVRKSMSLLEKKDNFQIEVYQNTDHSMNSAQGNVNPDYLDDKIMWLEEIKFK